MWALVRAEAPKKKNKNFSGTTEKMKVHAYNKHVSNVAYFTKHIKETTP